MASDTSAEALSRKTGMEALRARLMSSLAPSLMHALRGLLNTVVLTGEVVRLSATGKRDDAAAVLAGNSLRLSTSRFQAAFENFLNYLVTSGLEIVACEPGRAMRDAAALVWPLGLERKIGVEALSCPPGFTVSPLPGAWVPVFAFAAVEVLNEVANGGHVLFEARTSASGGRIVISGSPARIHAAPSRELSGDLEAVIARFGGRRLEAGGPGYSFDLPVSA